MPKSSFTLLLSVVLILIFVLPASGQTRVGKFGIGVDGTMQYVLGAGTVSSSSGLGGGINTFYSVVPGLGIRSQFGVSQIDWTTSPASNKKSVITDLMSMNFYLSADLMPNSRFNIFLFAGGGVAFFDPKDELGGRAMVNGSFVSSYDIHKIGGIGMDLFFDEFWSLTLMGEYVGTGSPHYVGNSTVAGLSAGDDSFMRIGLQLRYYFFDSSFITKLLEAQRDRAKRGK